MCCQKVLLATGLRRYATGTALWLFWGLAVIVVGRSSASRRLGIVIAASVLRPHRQEPIALCALLTAAVAATFWGVYSADLISHVG